MHLGFGRVFRSHLKERGSSRACMVACGTHEIVWAVFGMWWRSRKGFVVPCLLLVALDVACTRQGRLDFHLAHVCIALI